MYDPSLRLPSLWSTLLSNKVLQMLPPIAKPLSPADAIPAKHLHSSLNKARHAVNVVRWTPEGRRLLTGSYSGEFTLWNGTAFNFETIMQVGESTPHSSLFSLERTRHMM